MLPQVWQLLNLHQIGSNCFPCEKLGWLLSKVLSENAICFTVGWWRNFTERWTMGLHDRILINISLWPFSTDAQGTYTRRIVGAVMHRWKAASHATLTKGRAFLRMKMVIQNWQHGTVKGRTNCHTLPERKCEFGNWKSIWNFENNLSHMYRQDLRKFMHCGWNKE